MRKGIARALARTREAPIAEVVERILRVGRKSKKGIPAYG